MSPDQVREMPGVVSVLQETNFAPYMICTVRIAARGDIRDLILVYDCGTFKTTVERIGNCAFKKDNYKKGLLRYFAAIPW